MVPPRIILKRFELPSDAKETIRAQDNGDDDGHRGSDFPCKSHALAGCLYTRDVESSPPKLAREVWMIAAEVEKCHTAMRPTTALRRDTGFSSIESGE
jgi:hypothetical protein